MRTKKLFLIFFIIFISIFELICCKRTDTSNFVYLENIEEQSIQEPKNGFMPEFIDPNNDTREYYWNKSFNHVKYDNNFIKNNYSVDYWDCSFESSQSINMKISIANKNRQTNNRIKFQGSDFIKTFPKM